MNLNIRLFLIEQLDFVCIMMKNYILISDVQNIIFFFYKVPWYFLLKNGSGKLEKALVPEL